jgi:hypothetical protein
MMILDVPSGDDFRLSADDLLNLAWDNATTLLLDRVEAAGLIRLLREDSESTAGFILEGDNDYWRAAMPSLSSSLSLVQQAVEFFLKGTIVDISPYLLIADEPRHWPAGCSTQDVAFSSFRTLDAQDLPRVHDTVAANRLPATFSQWYEDMRTRRNRIMHTVATSIELRDRDIIQAVLETSEMFAGPQVWVNLRKAYLNERVPRRYSEQAVAPDDSHFAYALQDLQRETMTVIQMLTPSLAFRFFGFPKKQRRYLCLHCLSVRQEEYFFEYKNEEEFYLNTAVLVEPNPKCDRVHCVICGGTYRVVRQECNEEGCPSNVVDAHNGLCLVHDAYIEEGVSIQPRLERSEQSDQRPAQDDSEPNRS